MPVVVGLVLAAGSFLASHLLERQEVLQVSRLVAEEAQRMETALPQLIEARILALERMAARWVFHGEEDDRSERPEWQADAATYLEDQPELQAIEWADETFRVRWIAPIEGHAEGLDFELRVDERRRTTVEAAYSDRVTKVSDVIELAHGSKGFMVAVPLFPADAFDGFIIGMIDYQKLLEPLLSLSASRHFQIDARSAGELVYASAVPEPETTGDAWIHEASAPIRNVALELTVRPTATLVAEVKTGVPLAALIAGLLIAGLVAAALQLARAIVLRRLEGAEEIQALLEAAPDATIVGDRNGTIQRVNRRAEELFGYERSKLLQRSSWMLSAHGKRQDLQQVWRRFLDEPKAGILRGPDTDLFIHCRRSDGSEFPAEINLAPFDAPGGLLVIAAVRDVSERLLAEANLQSSEARYHELFDRVMAGVYQTTPEGRFLSVNPAMIELLGYESMDELEKLDIGDDVFVDPEDRERWRRRLEENGELHGVELQLRRKDGEIVTVREDSRIVRDAEGRTLHFEGTLTDITEYKKSEEALLASEQQARQFFENLDVGAFRSLASGAIVAINEAAALMLGFGSAEEMATTASAENLYVDPKQREALWDSLKNEPGVARAELSMRRKDGGLITVEATGRAIRDSDGNTLYHEGTLTDITERRRYEQALQASERQFRQFFENVGTGAFRTTPEGEFVSANSALASILGFDSIGELMSVRVDDLYVDPELRQARMSETEAQQDVMSFELELLRKDGREIVGLATSRPVVDDDGQTIYYEGTITDITERKRAEQALAASEEANRSLVENLMEGVCQTSVDGRFETVNSAMVQILGYDSAEELLELNLPRDVYARSEDRAAMLERLSSAGELRGEEVELKRKDGSSIAALINIRAIRDPEGQMVRTEGSLVDITSRKHLEEQLRQSQKMEAVGLLAGGVAHDFNNLLTGLSGFTEFALQKVRDSSGGKLSEIQLSIVEDLLEVRKAAGRAAGLTRQLLAFSRQQVLHPQIVELNSVVEGVERLLRRTIGEDVELMVELSEDSTPVLVDPGQLEQVLLNLAINARDAMSGGGLLRVKTDEANLDERFGRGQFDVVPGRYARLVVEDSGEGMDEATRSRALEPFFSTKGPGEGSGLGLSTVYGIIKQSRGYLWIDSTPGEGTRVEVYLPRLDEEAEPTEEVSPPYRGIGGRGTILLAEDDKLVRRLAARILETGGYEVLSAASADAAVELFEERSRGVDLVVTDIVMPGGSGTDLVDRLQVRQPDLKVLYISGHPTDEVRRRGVLDSDNFLAKPFTPDELLARVDDLLASDDLG